MMKMLRPALCLWIPRRLQSAGRGRSRTGGLAGNCGGGIHDRRKQAVIFPESPAREGVPPSEASGKTVSKRETSASMT